MINKCKEKRMVPGHMPGQVNRYSVLREQCKVASSRYIVIFRLITIILMSACSKEKTGSEYSSDDSELPEYIQDDDSGIPGHIRDGVWQLKILNDEYNCDDIDITTFGRIVVFRKFLSIDTKGKMYLSSDSSTIKSYHFYTHELFSEYEISNESIELMDIDEYTLTSCPDGKITATTTTALTIDIIDYDKMNFSGYKTIEYSPIDYCFGVLDGCRYEGNLSARWIHDLPFDVK